MEAIAEINDLACQAIEFGDYRIALDVLNSCLGCVKQLKRCRSSSMTEEQIYRTNNLNNPADEGRKTTIETIARLLKGTKRKLMNRSAARADIAAFTSRNNNNNNVNSNGNKNNKNKKRKVPNDISIAAAVIETSSRVRAVALPLKKRRRTTLDENPGEIQPAPPREAATTAVKITTTDSSRESKYSSTVVSNCSATVSEQRFFVYCKPLPLTKFQWYLIRQNSQINREQEHESQCHIDREIELAVSSNLIFNIALTHHMIAFPTMNPRGERPEFLPNKDGETDDDDTDDETGFEESASQTSSLKTTPRLKGALRLYELGFRVHTKRVAYVASASAAPQPRVPASFYPSSLATTTATATSVSRPTTAVGAAPWEQQQTHNTHTSTTTTTTDRDDELRSTTRFALALLNNCAHIHEALGQTEKALVFQKRLLSFLLVIVDSGESIHEIIGDDPAVDGYLKNVIAGTVFEKDTASAAVA